MITAKATKSAGSGPDPASRYRLAEKPASATPFGIGILLAGVGFYLRDLFPNWWSTGSAQDPQPAERPDPPMRPTLVAGVGERRAPEPGDGAAEPAPGPGGGLEPGPRPAAPGTHPEVALAAADAGPGMPRVSVGNVELRFATPRPSPASAANDSGPPSVALRPGGAPAAGDVPAPDGRDADDGDDRAGDDAAGGDADRDNGGAAVDRPDRDDPDRTDDPDDAEPEDEDDEAETNRAPVIAGPVQLADAFGCMAVLIGLTDLLRHASDPDGDLLSVRNVAVSSGTLARAGDGWLFDPAAMGSVVFSYEITDGALSTIQTARLTVRETPPVLGSANADILVGSDCADRIDAAGGDDIVDARGGSDIVEGGAGRDHVVAGDGHDTVFGGAGDDVIFGGRGDDRIWGGDGHDRLFGDDGDDVLHGEAGNDLIFGGAGDDLAFGGIGDDAIHGEAGDDFIDGEAGDDHLTGGDGDDTVVGGDGNDAIDGGAGNDLLSDGGDADVVAGGAGDDVVVAAADAADDAYDGGEGFDTLDYSASACAVEADLAAATVHGADIGRDTARNFEVLVTGAGDDRIADGGAVEAIRTAAGDDRVAAAADGRDDLYDGGAGCDTIDYGAAAADLVADLRAGTVTGGDVGSDRVANFEGFVAGSGDDTIWGSDAAETIHGGGGDDTIVAGGGSDVIHDGAGADSVAAGTGDDRVEAAADGADDAYDGGAGVDTLSYAATAAGVTVDLHAKTVTGIEVGRDAIGGFETIVGGSGDDTFIAHGEPVSFRGGKGDDLFDFSRLQGVGLAGQVAYEILDFVVGDRIRLSKHQLFEEVVDTLEDRFEDVYGDDLDDDDMPIRIRHERTDEMRRTYVEADMDRDDHYELSITLHGHHLLVMVEQA